MPAFTEKARKALSLAERAATNLHQCYVGTEHILLGLLQEKTGVAATILRNFGVEEEALKDMIQDLLAPETTVMLAEREGYSPRAHEVLEAAHSLARHYHAEQTGTEHLLLALLQEKESVAVRLLNTMDVPVRRMYAAVLSAVGDDQAASGENRESRPSRRRNASALEQYSRDLTALAKEGKLDPVIGREDEIHRMMQILSRRTKNNPCLVGEPGVGKTAVVEGLAARIAAGNVPPDVRDKRLLTLDLAGMVAGSKYRGEFEERIKKVIREVTEAGNIILFLDEVHTLIGAGGAEGAIDASNILKPSLARGEFQLIGATTIAEYRKYIEKDAALERRFQPVTIEEPTQEEAEEILQGIAYKYEEHHHVKILPEAIHAAVTLSARYINDRNLPDKAIDLIDEASAAVRLSYSDEPDEQKILEDEIKKLDVQIERSLRMEAYSQAAELRMKQEECMKKYERMLKRAKKNPEKNRSTVSENEIAEVVSTWTKIPVQKLEEKESDRLMKLESVLHKRVIGQDEAVKAVSRAIRRGRVGLQDPNRPIGSFLFLGPTGVGKTELSKALAEAVFGTENALIRVDMSEYMEGHSVSKMIGSPPGYVGFEEGGQLSEKVRRNPYSVVLFDEIEKAHPDVFNVLLQVLDDGHITDSKGRKVSFKNTILIMTSNAGAQRIIEPKNLGFGAPATEAQNYDKMKEGVLEEVKQIFKPEFINRIDEMLVFHPLNEDDMRKVVGLLTKNLEKRCHDQMNIDLKITPALQKAIVEKHKDAKMGARPMKRAIQTEIEDTLAEEVLSGRIREGEQVTATYKNGQVVYKK